jgi:hypothetical protein
LPGPNPFSPCSRPLTCKIAVKHAVGYGHVAADQPQAAPQLGRVARHSGPVDVERRRPAPIRAAIVGFNVKGDAASLQGPACGSTAGGGDAGERTETASGLMGSHGAQCTGLRQVMSA